MQNLNNNKLDLPITKLGSKRNILIFKILAAKQCGILIYPPVESSNFGFSFFRKSKDFKNEVIKKKGNAKILKFLKKDPRNVGSDQQEPGTEEKK